MTEVASETASNDGIDFDPRQPEVIQCPYPQYEALRAHDPVHKMPGAWIGRSATEIYAVSRYDLVAQVLSDPVTYSSQVGTPGSNPPAHLLPQLKEIASAGYERPPTMLTADPPVHTRYRRLVSKAFTPRRVSELTPTIEEICSQLCDGIDARVAAGETSVDMVEAFSVPIPTRTVAAALGVSQDRYADFKRWADASVATIGTQLSDEGWLEAARVVVELQQYFAGELEARLAEPRDDLLTDLTRVRLTSDDAAEGVDATPLTMGEMISIIQQLQVAGSETTASLITDAVLLMHQRPDEWEKLRADPNRAGAIVEEALRLSSPNLGMFRITTADTELGGVALPKGTTLWILFGSANRDDAAFAHPDELDPERPHLHQHLAFGRGPHYCIGAPLARLEATIALRTLAQRYERLEVLDPSHLVYGSSAILRGLTGLEVAPTPVAR